MIGVVGSDEAGHAVAVVVKAVAVGSGGVSGPAFVMLVGGATKDVAAGDGTGSGAQELHKGTVLNGVGRLVDAPIDPVGFLETIGITRAAVREDVIAGIQIHRRAQFDLLEVADAADLLAL